MLAGFFRAETLYFSRFPQAPFPDIFPSRKTRISLRKRIPILPIMPSLVLLNHNLAGQGTYFRNRSIAAALVRRGWTCTLLTVSPERRWRPSFTEDEGIRVIHTPRFFCPAHYAGSGCDLWDILWRIVYLWNTRPDAIFVSDHMPNVSLPALFCRLFFPRILRIADWADLYAEGGLHERWNRFFFSPIYRLSKRWEKRTKQQAHFCTATSRRLHERLATVLHIPAKQTWYLPAGCSSSPAEAPENRTRFGIPAHALAAALASSGGEWTDFEKQQATALGKQVFQATGNPLHLLLIGPFSPCDLPHIILHITGKTEAQTAASFLRSADFCLFLEPDTAYHRHRGAIRLSAYLSAGRPILCNRIADLAETIAREEAGVVLDCVEENPPELTRLLTDACWRKQLAENSRRLAEGPLAWDQVIAPFERHLRAILKEPLP
jgi:glycosyltransferase involved in cell wall biosynthesis